MTPPHLLFHLRHPNESLESLDTWLSNGGLAFRMLIALRILVAVSRAGRTGTFSPPPGPAIQRPADHPRRLGHSCPEPSLQTRRSYDRSTSNAHH